QVAVEKGDSRTLDGHVGPGTHGETDIGGGEGGRVVYTIPGERDDVACLAEPFDDVALVVGENLGLDAFDTEPTGYGLGGDSVVPGGEGHAGVWGGWR